MLDVSALSLDYGEVPVGRQHWVTDALVLTNAGGCDLEIAELAVRGDDSAFLASGDGPLVIPPGGTHAVSIEFRPTEDAAFSDTLVIASNDPLRPEVGVWLGGEGIAPKLSVEAPDAAIVPLGCVDTVPVALHSEGRARLSVSYELVGASGVSLLNDAAQPIWLDPGDAYTLLLEYQLVSRLGFGILEISTNDPNQSSEEVFLSLEADSSGLLAEQSVYDGDGLILEEVPIVETLEVKVDGVSTQLWAYDAYLNRVVLDEVAPGASISVVYAPASGCD